VTIAGGELTIGALVAEVEARLSRSSVVEAETEARDLVAAVAGERRFWPTVNRASPAEPHVAAAARAAAARRALGAPFAYAVGVAAFRHLTLEVDERVLIPRQETEELVDAVLARAHPQGSVADIGTGSGAIALALATEGDFARVVATDVSRDALAVAQRNRRRVESDLRCQVQLRCGALLAPLEGERFDVIVSNPPYIAYEEAADLPDSVRDWEPPIGLFSAGSGMAATTALIRQAPEVLAPGGLLALEVDARRASLAAEAALATRAYRDVSIRLDMAGRERIFLATREDG